MDVDGYAVLVRAENSLYLMLAERVQKVGEAEGSILLARYEQATGDVQSYTYIFVFFFFSFNNELDEPAVSRNHYR